MERVGKQTGQELFEQQICFLKQESICDVREQSSVVAAQVCVCVGVCDVSALIALGMLEVRVHWITHADLV